MNRKIASFIVRNRIQRTGNSVADYSEVWIKCPKCRGKGYIDNENPGEPAIKDCDECSGNGGYTKKY